METGANHPSLGDSGSFEHLNQDPNNYAPFGRWPLNGSIEIRNYPGVQSLQEPPREPSNLKIQKLREPKQEIEFSGSSGAPKDDQTSQIKFLKTIQSLILTLDMPTLSTLQAKIEKNIEESPEAMIPNDVMIPAMELMVAKIAHHSMSNLSENFESVGLSHLLCYLQALLLNSKSEGLEVLMEKIKERINNPAMKDKRIPVDKVARALQDTLYNVGF
ncbi:unnamed protein product [Caenorhabditis brenneri]